MESLLPIGGFGPYPHRLRDQFEGVVWRVRTRSQWREMPEEFGPWSTVYDRFCQWRDAGVFQGLREVMITEVARRGQVDLSLVSVDSTVVHAHHDAAGAQVSEDVLAVLEEAIEPSKGAAERHKTIKKEPKTPPRPTLPVPSGAGSVAGAAHG